MLTFTTTTLSNHTLILGSLLNEQLDKPVLVLIDWLNDDNWQDSKSICKIKTHYELADKVIQFIEENSLSINNNNLNNENYLAQTLLLATIAQFKQYEAGTRQTFSLPLDTSIGTTFQQKVWQALQTIPYGQTISYAQLAQNIEQPNAYRAVASANGKNPFSIVIPCHRVIASDGGLGGYTGGLDKKEWLLQIESTTKTST